MNSHGTKALFYPRLALRGMRSNSTLYTPYLLMSMLTIAVFYIMCYLCDTRVLAAMGAGEMTLLVMELGRWVIMIFGAIFLYYCNTFLVGRRMKEFGLYNVLGMGKGNIARIMLCETVETTLLSLIGGLVFGLSLARAAELLMIRILGSRITTGITFSWPGILLTVEIFGAISLVILLVNMLRMRIANPMELLNAQKAGEKPPRANYLTALFGAAFLGVGYYVAVTVDSPITAILLFFLAVIAVILGTYLLFIAGSVTVCRLLQRKKSYYYRTSHFISVSSMGFRMRRNGAGLATICILCTMVLVMLSSTLCLYMGIDDLLRITYPRDITITCTVHGDEPFSEAQADALVACAQKLTQEKGASSQNEEILRSVEALGYLEGSEFTALGYQSADNIKVTEIYFYPLSLYEAYSGEEISLPPDTLLYKSLRGGYRSQSLGFFGEEPYALQEADTLPEIFAAPCYRSIYDSVIFFTEDIDAIAAILSVPAEDGSPKNVEKNLHYYFDTDVEEEMVALLADLSDSMDAEMGRHFSSAVTLFLQDNASISEEMYGLFGGLFFIGLVLGAVFSLAAVLIIFYKQVSEGYEDAARFAVMRKVGLTDEEIGKSVNSQVLTVFYAPLLLSGVHVLFAMPMIRLMLRSFGMHNVALFNGVFFVCFAVFSVLYAVVYAVTSRTYYRIVR